MRATQNTKRNTKAIFAIFGQQFIQLDMSNSISDSKEQNKYLYKFGVYQIPWVAWVHKILTRLKKNGVGRIFGVAGVDP